MEVTSEEVHDGKVLKKLVKRASENNDVGRVLADGAYATARRISDTLMIWVVSNLPSR
ncbi:MAG: hypothetical protein HRF40_04110 [Nitrososphaera sp.]